MAKRKYRNKSEWQSLVKDYRDNYSDISKTSYCKKKGIAVTTFCKWCKEYPEERSFKKVDFNPKTGYLKLFGLNLVKFELNV